MNSGFDNLNRLHDLARGQAAVLRLDAISRFWRGAHGLLVRCVRQWAARLIRRSPGYGVRSSTPTSGA